ncbi:hypothetical protein H2198_003306 [Neophaeococcomyces mojaviensis]|uniref:Uncharacterized protein n=1 Tax=Neophaeococcomyces mojaviensis TaxID=3383035 RepID=A0ACC3ACN4_9EURO|nr:hypothetical protein H2198_003306 [Knufia sp. JES_112]
MTVSETTPPASGEFNVVHLELLYFWSTESHRSFMVSSAAPLVYADTCIRQGLRHPFLMQQILATSALHLSIERPSQKTFYRHHATQLQATALAEFKTILQKLDESNIVSAFLFSSLVGLHVFCDTFSSGETDFNQVLDSLISCINLLRGVRSIIGGWWTYLLTTELSPILTVAADKRQAGEDNPYPLRDLADLIAEADIGAASREAYQETLKELERGFADQVQLSADEGATTANMIFAWLVIVPKEYVELLSQRRPEALIILSHYAVLLHYRRHFWAIGDSGKFLVEGITSHLGKHWEKWLTWPKSIAVV